MGRAARQRAAGARLALVLAGAMPLAVDGPPGPGTTERQLIALALAEGGETTGIASVLGELPRAAFMLTILRR